MQLHLVLEEASAKTIPADSNVSICLRSRTAQNQKELRDIQTKGITERIFRFKEIHVRKVHRYKNLLFQLSGQESSISAVVGRL